MFTDFYKLQNIDIECNTTYCCKVELNANHEIFKAHFPKNPITPGVCILQIAKELISRIENSSITIKTVKNIKFLSIISPSLVVELTYHITLNTVADNCKEAKIVVCQGETTYTKISLHYELKSYSTN